MFFLSWGDRDALIDRGEARLVLGVVVGLFVELPAVFAELFAQGGVGGQFEYAGGEGFGAGGDQARLIFVEDEAVGGIFAGDDGAACFQVVEEFERGVVASDSRREEDVRRGECVGQFVGMDFSGEEDAVLEAQGGEAGVVCCNFAGCAADDDGVEARILAQGDGEGREEQVHALINGKGADVEGDD